MGLGMADVDGGGFTVECVTLDTQDNGRED